MEWVAGGHAEREVHARPQLREVEHGQHRTDGDEHDEGGHEASEGASRYHPDDDEAGAEEERLAVRIAPVPLAEVGRCEFHPVLLALGPLTPRRMSRVRR